jgi:hypothetical protein
MLYVLLDLFITAVPVRIYHFIHGMTMNCVYLIFSAVYTLSGGTNALDQPYIYTVLDWNSDPVNGVLYGLLPALIGSPIIWLCVFGIYRVRIALYYCIYTVDFPQNKSREDTTGQLSLPENGQSPNYGSIP